jgi:hypothetical protein
MRKKIKWEYFRAIYPRYRKGTALQKTQILDEFCEVCGYNRKYAIAKLNGPFPAPKTPAKRAKRCVTYTAQARSCKPSGRRRATLWSVRLKALLTALLLNGSKTGIRLLY